MFRRSLNIFESILPFDSLICRSSSYFNYSPSGGAGSPPTIGVPCTALIIPRTTIKTAKNFCIFIKFSDNMLIDLHLRRHWWRIECTKVSWIADIMHVQHHFKRNECVFANDNNKKFRMLQKARKKKITSIEPAKPIEQILLATTIRARWIVKKSDCDCLSI